MSKRLQVQLLNQILHWFLSMFCHKAGYIFLLNLFLLEISLLMWGFLFLFYLVCSLVMWHNVQIKKNIFRWISNMFNTDGIFHPPSKHRSVEFICRRAVLRMGFMGGMHLFSKLWKTSHFMKKTTNPLGSTEAFISKLNCFCPLFLENLQGVSRFWMLMFAISCKRKYPSPQFFQTLNSIHIWIFIFWWIADHNDISVPWKKLWAFFFNFYFTKPR